MGILPILCQYIVSKGLQCNDESGIVYYVYGFEPAISNSSLVSSGINNYRNSKEEAKNRKWKWKANSNNNSCEEVLLRKDQNYFLKI